MRESHGKGASRLSRRKVIIAIAVTCFLTALGGASPALAHPPTGILARFAQCPTTGPNVELCLFAETTSGEFKIGKTTIPINKPIILQGGLVPTPQESVYVLAAAKNGNTLSKTELNVPGGITGIMVCAEIKGEGPIEKAERKLCEKILESGPLGLTATAELVATATNPAVVVLGDLFGGTGPGVILPIRVHLQNPLLGNACYVGSAAKPIQLVLTDGTTSPPPPNKPISGKLGSPFIETEGEVQLLATEGITLVDNSFAAPEAEGCGGLASALINPIINKRIGLPSAAGNNTAILTGSLRIAAAEEVAESENK
jgi:hypothetical protein